MVAVQTFGHGQRASVDMENLVRNDSIVPADRTMLEGSIGQSYRTPERGYGRQWGERARFVSIAGIATLNPPIIDRGRRLEHLLDADALCSILFAQPVSIPGTRQGMTLTSGSAKADGLWLPR